MLELFQFFCMGIGSSHFTLFGIGSSRRPSFYRLKNRGSDWLGTCLRSHSEAQRTQVSPPQVNYSYRSVGWLSTPPGVLADLSRNRGVPPPCWQQRVGGNYKSGVEVTVFSKATVNFCHDVRLYMWCTHFKLALLEQKILILKDSLPVQF